MKDTIVAWSIWIFGNILLMFLDYYIRNMKSSIDIPDLVFVALLLFIAVISLWYAFNGTKNVKNIYGRIAILIGEGLVGWFVLGFAWFFYTVKSGIDSM